MSDFYLRDDNLVRADGGLVKIKDLKPGMRVQSFVENDRLFYHGIVEAVRFVDDCQFWSLRAGKRELFASENTPVITSWSDGYIWRRLADFRPGALMLIQNLDTTATFHEPIIEITEAGQGRGAVVSLSRYENFVVEGMPIHTISLPHEKKNEYFNF